MTYIKAKVIIKMDKISGPYEQIISWLVNTPNIGIAKQKFEERVRNDFAHMQARTFTFDYLEIAGMLQ